jgi:DNA-binding CsgD family transcriptional regulator
MGSLGIRALFFGVLIVPAARGKEQDMLIHYDFYDGDKEIPKHIVVEVDEELGNFILESRREESNGDRRQSYHCTALFDDDDKCEELMDERDPLWYLERNETERETWEKIDNLTETQRRRTLMRMEGMSEREIARREGCDHKAVAKSLKQVGEKYLKEMK